jgi:hypothetical protein
MIRSFLKSAALAGSILSALFILNTGTSFSQMIPADRQVRWQGNVGIAGGIPARTAICATLIPSGGDDTAAIQNALNACPPNQVVKLESGTFFASGSIEWQMVNNGVVLRGSGPANTTISFSSGGMMMRGTANEAALSTAVPLAADAVKGQTTLTLASVPEWIKVGHLYILDQLDDPSLVAGGGTEGGRSYREITGNGPRGLGQLVRITGISSNQVTVEIPLYYGFQVGRSAQLAKAAYDPMFSAPKFQCGLEDLKLTATYSNADAHMIKMEFCDSCWIKNVESYNSAGGAHVFVDFSYRCEIRDSYFHVGQLNMAGQGYGVALYHVSSACLIENNIFEHLHAGMMVCYGSSGNVFGYNYERDGVADSGQFPAISTHGTHAYMNLWEGNYVEDKALGDWTHGSSSHNTLFRNRIVGYHSGATLDQTAVSIEQNNRKWNIVGNILGMEGWHDIDSLCASGECSQTTCNDSSKAIYKLGYRTNWACDYSAYDNLSMLSPIIHGNYDMLQHATIWNNAISDHAIGTSYYLTGKPSWFGSLAWPPFDPSHPETADPSRIPAGVRLTGNVISIQPVNGNSVNGNSNGEGSQNQSRSGRWNVPRNGNGSGNGSGLGRWNPHK